MTRTMLSVNIDRSDPTSLHDQVTGQIRKAIEALGLSDVLKVSYGRSPRLAAMLRTPRGVVTL